MFGPDFFSPFGGPRMAVAFLQLDSQPQRNERYTISIFTQITVTGGMQMNLVTSKNWILLNLNIDPRNLHEM